MKNDLANKIVSDTKQSYNYIADKFSNTRYKQWPIMENLAQKYVKNDYRIMDVGCGNGRLYDYLVNAKGYDIGYLGLDTSEELINKAKQTGGNFIVKDILEMDLYQELDIVFVFAVLNHLPSQAMRQQAMDNIYKTLKVGGRLIMTNWNFWRLNFKQKTVWRYKIVQGLRSKVEGPKTKGLGFKDVITYFDDHGAKRPLYYRAFTLRELKKLAKKSGFVVEEAYYENKGYKANWLFGNNLVLIARKD